VLAKNDIDLFRFGETNITGDGVEQMRSFFDRPAQQWHLVRRTDSQNTSLAIFVHGFRGNYLTTWGNLATCLSQRSDAHPIFTNWDYLFLGYDSATIGNLLLIAAIIRTQWEEAAAGDPPFGAPYNEFALFGHSLGTLGIRQLLCATSLVPPGLESSLKSVVLFGSPLNGSPLAPYGKMLGLLDILKGPSAAAAAILPSGYKITESLMEGGAVLQMLRVWNESARKHLKLPNALTYQGTGDWVVGPGRAEDSWAGDVKKTLNLDHGQLSKINSSSEWSNSPFRDALEKALK
jgi:hypothetical protein